MASYFKALVAESDIEDMREAINYHVISYGWYKAENMHGYYYVLYAVDSDCSGPAHQWFINEARIIPQELHGREYSALRHKYCDWMRVGVTRNLLPTNLLLLLGD